MRPLASAAVKFRLATPHVTMWTKIPALAGGRGKKGASREYLENIAARSPVNSAMRDVVITKIYARSSPEAAIFNRIPLIFDTASINIAFTTSGALGPRISDLQDDAA